MEQIDIRTISPHPLNPRKDVGDIQELKASIEHQGVLQPIVVIPGSIDSFEGLCRFCNQTVDRLVSGVLTEHETTGFRCPGSQEKAVDEYLVIMGHRRLAAAKEAGLERVPIVVRGDLAADSKAVAVMLAENIHRAGLTVIEESEAFQQLSLMGLADWEIAHTTGVQRVRVERGRQLLTLPQRAQNKVLRGQITVEEALVATKHTGKAQERIEAATSLEEARYIAAQEEGQTLEEAAATARAEFVTDMLKTRPDRIIRDLIMEEAVKLFATGKSVRITYQKEAWQTALVGLQAYFESRPTQWERLLVALGYEPPTKGN